MHALNYGNVNTYVCVCASMLATCPKCEFILPSKVT